MGMWLDRDYFRNDFDLWVITPTGEKIWYKKMSTSGGSLDHDHLQDQNNGAETITIEKDQLKNGKYSVYINDFRSDHGRDKQVQFTRTLDHVNIYRFGVNIAPGGSECSGNNCPILVDQFTY